MSFVDYLTPEQCAAQNREDEDHFLTQVERAIRAIPARHMTHRVAREILCTLTAAMIRSPYAHLMDEAINQLCNAEGDLWKDEQ